MKKEDKLLVPKQVISIKDEGEGKGSTYKSGFGEELKQEIEDLEKGDFDKN